MSDFFNEILFRPLLNATVFIYNVIPGKDFGVAIITLTVLVRLAFLPLTFKTMRSQKAMNDISPKINAVKEKFKNDKAAQSAEILKLYKDNNINPISGCLPLLIQIPILIALYKAFGSGFSPDGLTSLYSFVSNPGQIDPISLGFLNISIPNHLLTILTGIIQFIQIRASSSANSNASKEMQAMNKQMMYIFPVIIIIIGWNLPAALMLYWITATLASMAEQVYIKRTSQG